MSLQLQHTDNPSGTFQTGGIGEPKFNVDGSPFTGSWGRPQNDGPALRSITAARYMAHVLDTRSISDASRTFVTQQLWAANGVKDPEAQGKRRLLIRDDLDYICREWQSKTFELWEEVCADAGAGGGHFHVLMTQRRALLEGAALARRTETLDEVAAKRWDEAAAAITNRLEKFWNAQGKLNLEGGPDEGSNIDWHDERHLSSIGDIVLASPHVLPTLNRVSGQHKPTQADCAVLLGFTHGWDGDVGLKADDTWEPWGERCLATLWRNVQVFAKVYPVNRGRDPVRDGVLCGRYPEDVYDGVGQSIGNPWFLTTFAVSNVLYLTLAHHARTSLPITLTPATLSFFSNFLDAGHARAGATYHRGSHEWESIMRGMREMAEVYLTNAARFAEQRKGKMSEQIDRYSGWMRGARELSWSFASFLAVHQARRLSSSV
ncbi:Six-hairpin glycosidase [Jaminaea rosea]|uniref:glucan 1,4-alpha-glucosidase n=1 Tax=Jaminaea rosea TaxID=1569628 RepID=A0A316V230_9BASI|nr:Six-hairpin glycosidase [Jaminaea rosea]PWN31058.1 Six-hairpin glycosidase [Jaminaea rosea]